MSWVWKGVDKSGSPGRASYGQLAHTNSVRLRRERHYATLLCRSPNPGESCGSQPQDSLSREEDGVLRILPLRSENWAGRRLRMGLGPNLGQTYQVDIDR
jgi:hypothetical protein